MNYSCTKSISKIIDNHKELINKPDWNNKDNLKRACNSEIQNECILKKNKCNPDNIVYQANISA